MDQSAISAQLATFANRQADIQRDVAVILERTLLLKDHETRIRRLEDGARRVAALVAVGTIVGIIIGWAATYFGGRR